MTRIFNKSTGIVQVAFLIRYTLLGTWRSSACASTPSLQVLQHLVTWGLGGVIYVHAGAPNHSPSLTGGLGGGLVCTPLFFFRSRDIHKFAVQGQSREGPSAAVLY
ncbi:hypothetical protein EDD22DRAFT_850778 [Suillus occidentalis]|nr:hypothetical protein EDD22DRAFT_850778 [Suillus occidentalis]